MKLNNFRASFLRTVCSVPSSASFTDDLSVWVQWAPVQSGASSSLTEVHLNGTTVWSENVDRAEEGYMLTINRANLTSNPASSTWADTNGLEWSTYHLALEFTEPTNAWYDHLSLPWSMTARINLTGAVNDAILGDCGSFYAFTAGSCYGQSTLHRLSLTGISQPVGSPAFSFDITDPSFAWTDTYAPQLSSIQHRKGIVELPDLRVNESFSIVLFDVAGEDDLTVEYLGLDWEEADGFGGAQTMLHHNGLTGYYIYQNTENLDVNSEHQLNMTFRLLDAQGNELLPRPTYQVDVAPAYPAISSFELTGPTKISQEGSVTTWGVDEAHITMTMTERQHRSNLDVTATLSFNGTGQTLDLPLAWDDANMTYSTAWQPDRTAMGEWHIELTVAETTGLMAVLEEGWQSGADAVVHLVDVDGPAITNISHPVSLEPDEQLTVGLTWHGAAGETYQGSIAVVHEGAEVANKSILATQATNASLVFETTGWAPGTYNIEWWLEDDAGNSALDATEGEATVSMLAPLISTNLGIDQVEGTQIRIAGEVESRSGSSTMTLTLEGSTWSFTETLPNGQHNVSVDVDGFSTPKVNATLTVCDEVAREACQAVTQQLNFTEAFALNATHECSSAALEAGNASDHTLLTCEVENAGRGDVVFSLLVGGSTPDGLTVDAPVVVSSGGQAMIGIHIPASTTNITETVSWTLLAEDIVGTSSTLEVGTFDVSRTPEPPVEEIEDEVETAGESSGLMTAVIGLVLVVILGGLVSYRVMRRNDTDSPLLTDESTGGHNTKSVVDIPDEPQESDPMVEAEGNDNRPTIDTLPTSVDDHGYEWYSSDEGHWYRTEGSHSEWLRYQP